jgi:ribulose 1,5-bisphosphate carboxylase large subunit-like protein
MTTVSPTTLQSLWHDADLREELLREIVASRLSENPPPRLDDHIVGSYFLALRTKKLHEVGDDISYHATSGIHDPPPGSLLEQCTGKAVGVDAWDASGRLGLLHMAYPLKMLLDAKGALTSCDMLHTAAGAILFDVYENQDSRLLRLTIPEHIIRTFPGPAYGPHGIREATGFAPYEPAFGTILKPTAGITPVEVGALLQDIARCPLFMFVKEDENLYPSVPYSPVAARTQQAVAAIERSGAHRGDKGLVFAPHVTSAPHLILDAVHSALDAGARGVMFSESFAGGTVRMVREATKKLDRPPVIYGHNAGIGVRTRCIWRDVIDYLARLDGIDVRQTAPVRPGPPFILPYRAEWLASEETLTMPLPGIKPVMIARAGGLDQGNIILNLQDAAQRGRSAFVLFLAGSAINSVKNSRGEADPRHGARAMEEAIVIHNSGELRGIGVDDHLEALKGVARRMNFSALLDALQQRYAHK